MTSKTILDQSPILIPVFVTADVPGKTLDLLIERSLRHPTKENFRLRIVHTTDRDDLSAITTGSQPPMPNFVSPFHGKILYQLYEIFLMYFKPLEQFTNSYFVVLDGDALTSDDDLGNCLTVKLYNEDDGQIIYHATESSFYRARGMADDPESRFSKWAENKRKEEEKRKREEDESYQRDMDDMDAYDHVPDRFARQSFRRAS